MEKKQEKANYESWMSSVHDNLNEIKAEIYQLKNEEKTKEISNRLETVTNELKNVTNNTDGRPYADIVKSKKMLIIKSTNQSKKAVDNKKLIMSKLQTPVTAVKDTRDGHFAVQFDSRLNLEEAKKELEENSTDEIVVNEKGKLKPKIKIVNVTKMDEDVIENLKRKNKWIANLIENDDDLILKKEVDSRDVNKKHCIIKCSPKIRKAIYEHKDKVFTMMEQCNVYDAYQPYQCYKCQEFGHSADKCSNQQACPKCGGNHKYIECKVDELKCKNCAKRENIDTDHKTFDRNNCTIYKEEIARIKNHTDHGFD